MTNLMHKLSAIIVDDEPNLITSLKLLLETYCTQVEVVGTAKNVDEAVTHIEKQQPDIVFLDIEMPEKSGFALFDEVEPTFQTIFITAYEEYALKAFEVSAVDYLLKPIEISKLQRAVEKTAQKNANQFNKIKYNTLQKNIQSTEIQQITIPIKDGFEFVKVKDIILMEADRMYTKLYTKNAEKPLLVSKPVKYFINLLEENQQFYRPHRSYFIHLKYIKRFTKLDGGTIEMSNGMLITLSKSKVSEFKALFGQF